MLKFGYNFLDALAAEVYAEKRYELEKLAGMKDAGRFLTNRARTRDAAGAVFTYRMTGGFPGDVNRTHPASIEPCLIDASAPPTAYGQAVLVDGTAHSIRPFTAGDNSLTDLYGVTVRPFPLQQNSTTGSFGSATPPVTGVIDVIRAGYVVVQLGNGALTGAFKGGTVYVDTSSSTGNYVQGGFQAAAGGQTVATMNGTTLFNGSEDAKGWVELSVHYGG